MRVTKRAMVAPAAAAAAVAMVACAQSLDTAKLQSSIQSKLGEVDLKADSITCPSSIEAKAGNNFECTATVKGVPVKVSVTQKDDQGNVSYDIGSEVFSTEKVVPAVESYFKDQGATAVTVTCPKGVVVAGGNGDFTCTATADGQGYTVKVPLKDGVAQLADAEVQQS